VCCSSDAKNFQRLKTSGATDIAATATLGISIICVSLSVNSNVNRDVDLSRGASLLRLELKDDWTLIWKEVSVCHLVVVPVELIFVITFQPIGSHQRSFE